MKPTRKLYNQDNKSKYVKDAFHEYVVDGKQEVVNPENKEQKPLLGLHLKISQLGVCYYPLQIYQ